MHEIRPSGAAHRQQAGRRERTRARSKRARPGSEVARRRAQFAIAGLQIASSARRSLGCCGSRPPESGLAPSDCCRSLRGGGRRERNARALDRFWLAEDGRAGRSASAAAAARRRPAIAGRAPEYHRRRVLAAVGDHASAVITAPCGSDRERCLSLQRPGREQSDEEVPRRTANVVPSGESQAVGASGETESAAGRSPRRARTAPTEAPVAGQVPFEHTPPTEDV